MIKYRYNWIDNFSNNWWMKLVSMLHWNLIHNLSKYYIKYNCNFIFLEPLFGLSVFNKVGRKFNIFLYYNIYIYIICLACKEKNYLISHHPNRFCMQPVWHQERPTLCSANGIAEIAAGTSHEVATGSRESVCTVSFSVTRRVGDVQVGCHSNHTFVEVPCTY